MTMSQELKWQSQRGTESTKFYRDLLLMVSHAINHPSTTYYQHVISYFVISRYPLLNLKEKATERKQHNALSTHNQLFGDTTISIDKSERNGHVHVKLACVCCYLQKNQDYPLPCDSISSIMGQNWTSGLVSSHFVVRWRVNTMHTQKVTCSYILQQSWLRVFDIDLVSGIFTLCAMLFN